MGQWEKVFTSKSDGLNSLQDTHILEAENQLPQLILWSLKTHTHSHMCIHK